MTARRRLRSGSVVLGGAGALATELAARGDDPDKRCVDPRTHRSLPGSRRGSGAATHTPYGSVGGPAASAVDRGGFGGSPAHRPSGG